jgi:hypothetical protein
MRRKAKGKRQKAKVRRKVKSEEGTSTQYPVTSNK